MIRVIATGLFIVAAIPIVPAADSMYGTIDGWGQMIDPDGDCRFEVGKNVVTVTFGPGKHGLDAEQDRMNAPRVLRSVDGDFSVSTIVKGNLPLPEVPYAYVSGGLVLMQDSRNYIRLERASFIRNGNKSYYTNFEQRIDAKRTRMGRFADFPLDAEQDVELRLEVSGENVRALVRHVGEDWHEMGTARMAIGNAFHTGISGVKTIPEEVDVTFTHLTIGDASRVEAGGTSNIRLSSAPSGPITADPPANPELPGESKLQREPDPPRTLVPQSVSVQKTPNPGTPIPSDERVVEQSVSKASPRAEVTARCLPTTKKTRCRRRMLSSFFHR